jgi:hypothetical protein
MSVSVPTALARAQFRRSACICRVSKISSPVAVAFQALRKERTARIPLFRSPAVARGGLGSLFEFRRIFSTNDYSDRINQFGLD